MQLEKFVYIAHCNFFVQVPKLVVCIQDIGSPGCILPFSELVQGRCGVQ